jgi:hypothetical protein
LVPGDIRARKRLDPKRAFVYAVASTRFGREILFFLHPLLEPTLKDSPLSTNLEGRYLAVLNHPMQRSFRNL